MTPLSTVERTSHAPAIPAAPTDSTMSAMTATACSRTASGDGRPTQRLVRVPAERDDDVPGRQHREASRRTLR